MKADATRSGDLEESEAATAAEGDFSEETKERSVYGRWKPSCEHIGSAHGKADRKKVAEMKAGAATSAEGGAEQPEAAKEAIDTSAEAEGDAPAGAAGEAEEAAAE